MYLISSDPRTATSAPNQPSFVLPSVSALHAPPFSPAPRPALPPGGQASAVPVLQEPSSDAESLALPVVLVIDDAQASRELLEELLAVDYRVMLAASGADGLAQALHTPPDLILLDVLMPDMDGYEVLRRLKAHPRTAQTPVIFITGLDRPEDEARSLLLGGSDFISKPFNVPVVYARVALHLRLARHRRQLEDMINIDALTGIANRRQFDQVLAAECRRAQRTGQSVSVAMVDVDYFKQYNDTHGHTLGDKALRAVAQVLHQGMRRPGDLAARYGGEEFGLVIVDADADRARSLVQARCDAVRELRIGHPASKVADVLTVSIGVASVAAADGLHPDRLLQRADDCLYRAKAAGRARVVGMSD